jgi:hypothetical protein
MLLGRVNGMDLRRGTLSQALAAPRGYDQICRLAKLAGQPIPRLLALARQNDPFFVGSRAQQAQARWFAGLWRDCGFSSGVHLRRVHYRILSIAGIRRHDATPYENTDTCWNYLCQAAKYARYLSLVAPDAFVDQRNPDPVIYAAGREAPEPDWWIPPADGWMLPRIASDLSAQLRLEHPWPVVGGYAYDDADQPYHVEVWVEKSTMDDVLIPLCRELGVNLVTSVGFQSITSVCSLLRRVVEYGKPVRVLYISDFDPAGDKMPAAVARQAEYWLPAYVPNAEVKLTPLALTREQVTGYRLPRIPVKSSDTRKANFERRYGRGAVELDALEALFPGVLAQLVRHSIAPYRDATLPARLRATEQEANAAVAGAWAGVTAGQQAELGAIEREARAIARRYEGALERLDAELQRDLAPLQARLDALRERLRDAAGRFDAALPERPQPKAARTDEGGWLFDSRRDYLTQLDYYRGVDEVRSA